MGILSGLEKYGLENLDVDKLFETEHAPVNEKQESKETDEAVAVFSEADYLYDKSYTCPVCDSVFSAKTVRNAKVVSIGTDVDLRPRYEHVDVNKYDSVVCPYCGYGAQSKSFGGLTSRQIHIVRENISKNFVPQLEKKEGYYSYEEAIERIKIVLANAIVKQAKSSEKAYILLKTAWLYRGMAEQLDLEVPANRVMKKIYAGQEKEYLKSAVEGFEAARMQEPYPISGMDEQTLDYLIAAIHILLSDYKPAELLIGQLITSRTANKRVKDRVRELKEFMEERKKEENGCEK